MEDKNWKPAKAITDIPAGITDFPRVLAVLEKAGTLTPEQLRDLGVAPRTAYKLAKRGILRRTGTGDFSLGMIGETVLTRAEKTQEVIEEYLKQGRRHLRDGHSDS